MKIKIMLLGLLGLWLTATTGFAESVCSHVNIEWVSFQITLPSDAKIIQKQEKGQLCEVILSTRGNLLPVYAGEDFILAGQLFKEGKSITRATMKALSDVAEKERRIMAEKKALKKEKRKIFFKKNINKLEEFVSFPFKPENPPENPGDFLYLITDPNCHHCKNLLPRLKSAARESGIEIKVIIYPILGVKSRELASQAICNKYSFQDYAEIKGSDSVSSCEKADLLIGKTVSFFRSAGVSFVPLVIAGDGSWVVESNDIEQIRFNMGIDPTDGENGSGGACLSDQDH